MHNTSPKPRILLVSATSIFGGGEVHYVKLAKILLEHYELAAVAFNPMLQKELEDMGIPVWRGEGPIDSSIPKRYLVISRCLLKALRNFRPQLVHLNGGPEVFLGVIPWALRIPTLITYHTYTKPSESLHKRLLLALCCRIARNTICVSETVQKNLRDTVWATNTIVIPNWLSVLPAKEQRPAFEKGTRDLSLLFVGRIEAAKGIFDLLAAMKHVQNVRLDIVGEGPCMARAMAESIDLPVTFHGFRKDVATFYKNTDMLVLPSYSEGHPLVLVEAMSWGVPCLISDIPASVETAGGGQFALTYRVGDADDMAKTIRSIQEHPSRLIPLSENGQRYASAKYSEQRTRSMYFDLLQSVLGI